MEDFEIIEKINYYKIRIFELKNYFVLEIKYIKIFK